MTKISTFAWEACMTAYAWRLDWVRRRGFVAFWGHLCAASHPQTYKREIIHAYEISEMSCNLTVPCG